MKFFLLLRVKIFHIFQVFLVGGPGQGFPEDTAWPFKVKRLIEHFQNALQEDDLCLLLHGKLSPCCIVEIYIIELERSIGLIKLISKVGGDCFLLIYPKLVVITEFLRPRVI